MGKGKGPVKYDFNEEVGGRAHLKPVDWTNSDHKRIVAACLVQGVYVLECDRQEGGEISLPPERPWFTFFNFKLDRMLIHEKGTIYGAIYRFEPPSHLPPEAPKYVIAFRGTLLKEESFKEDVKLDIKIIVQLFHKETRTIQATKAVESVVFPQEEKGTEDEDENDGKDNHGPVWLVGHSLGSALAIQAGKKVAEKGVFLETFLFDPPFPSLGPEIIRDKGIRHSLQKTKRKLKTKAASLIKSSKQIHEDRVKFAKLSEWSPHVFVNQNDWICSGYIGYFQQRESEINSTDCVLDAMYSTRALFKHALGRTFKKTSDYEPFYLFPSASLTINKRNDTEMGSHGIKQWWMAKEDLQLSNTRYSFDLSKLAEDSE